ncbi:hypothetical protein PZ938_02245 [Luteipulveratus sp. YIM 133132]|uniref:hypothetical protein n=1 Tax=Luteipulveratus flavus TaxID=3031728 RepID=UPI0023AE706D|nr:hypothetical protein [Luteipulveratus sp. YIM 133132]MDE9364414.1 hypothetical protein [Luteipulveratus sp. YIM 133132]
MPFRKSRSEKVRDRADDLTSAAVDALGSVKEKVTPYVEDAVDRAAPAARAALDKAKDTAAPVAERTKEAAQPKVHTVISRAKDSDAREKVAAFAVPAKDKVAAAAAPAKDKVAASAAPAREKAAAFAAPAIEKAQDAGLTKDQASSLFSDEWMPRIQNAIAAAAATTSAAVAKLPEPAQDTVARVAPGVVKRKQKGKLLIAVGVIALAGAAALYVSGQQKKKSDPWHQAEPNQEPTPVNPTQASTGDLVGDTERATQAELAGPGGATRGRHSAG